MLRTWLADWKILGRIVGSKKRRSPRQWIQPERVPNQSEVLEDRTLLSTFYVDDTADYVITDDQGAAGLDDGDEVTWDTAATHPEGPVTGLILGSDAFDSIQDALDAADASADPTETVNVAAGHFVEDLEFVATNTNVELAGAGSDQTTIKGVVTNLQADFPLATPNINILASGAQIHDFTIESPAVPAGSYSSGIVIDSPDVELFENEFVSIQNGDPPDGVNDGRTNVIIQTYAGSNSGKASNVDGLHIHDNTISGFGKGYYGVFVNPQGEPAGMDPADAVRIENNQLTGNIWRGIEVERSNAVIDGNTLSANSSTLHGWGGSGIAIRDFGTANIDNVTISNNEITGFNGADGRGFTDAILVGFGSETLTNVSLEGNTSSENETGIRIHADTTADLVSEMSTNVGNGLEMDAPGDLFIDGGTFSGIVLQSATSLTTNNTVTSTSAVNLQVTGDVDVETGGLAGEADVTFSPGGTATFALGTTSTYTGTTTITTGSTLVNGVIDDGGAVVTVQSGATLGGNGSVNRNVDVESGGTVVPGTSPGILTQGDTNFMAGSMFDVEVNGVTTMGTDYDQLDVTGTVDIDTSATLNTAGTVTGTMAGDAVVIIDNDGSDLVTGHFSGLPDEATLAINGETFQIFYDGGDGNDVVLAASPETVNTVYVNDDFTGTDGTMIADADPNSAGDQTAVIGINAFDTIQEGVDAVASGGTVNVTDDLEIDGTGTYVENVTIDKDVSVLGTEGDPEAVVVDGGQTGSTLDVGATFAVTLDSLTIQNGSATEGGGINSAGNLTVDNSIIQNNTANNDGGGIRNSGGTVTIQGESIISGNSAQGSAGGISNTGILTVQSSMIARNTADSSGGGIRNRGTLSMNDSTVVNNTTRFGGGGIYNGFLSMLTVRDSTIENNTANSRGGALWNGFGTMTIDGTTIDGNTATGGAAIQGGGGIYINDGRVDLSSTVSITNNVADGDQGSGGGILNLGGMLTAEGTTITGNTANRAGGGIEDNSGSGLGITLNDVTLDNNVAGPDGAAAPGNGGGLHVTGPGDVTITGGTVNGNSAALEGGGLWNGSGTMTIDGVTIDGNTASGLVSGQGGGGIFSLGNLNITGESIITENFAGKDGGGVLSSGTATIEGDSTIARNVAGPNNTAGNGGGGVMNFGAGTMTLRDVTIADNTARSGGGIAINGTVGIVTVHRSTIEGNTAADGIGGGIFNQGTFYADNSTISSNLAGGFPGGGGIWNGNEFNLTNVTISGNHTDGQGGGILTRSGDVSINNSTIAENQAGTGGGIHHDDTGTVTLNSSIVATNRVGGADSDVSGTVAGTFNLIGVDTGLTGIAGGTDDNQVGTAGDPLDPRLSPLADNGGPAMTYAILPDSPALDAGDNPEALAFDQRGMPFQRTFGSQTDVGAYELQGATGGGNDIIATAPGAGTVGEVRVIGAITQEELFTVEPYPGFQGGVRVAVGDVDGDQTPDLITGAGPGGGPHVKVINGSDGVTELFSFFAYDAVFSGGVYVAAGDVNDDGMADIIVGADAGGGPHVRVFSGENGDELFSFFAYDARFPGGVRVAAGDISGDGRSDLITGAGPSGGPHVRVFDGETGDQLPGQIGSFFAYEAGFPGGVFVAAGDVSGDGHIDLITGAGAGGGPHVKVFDGKKGSPLPGDIGSFFAFDAGFRGGVRMAASDITGDGRPDVITGAGQSGDPHVRAFNAATGEQIRDLFVENAGFSSGIFVVGSVVQESSPALPLRLADGFSAGDSPAALTASDVEPVFDAALARLEAAGLSGDVARSLSAVIIEVSDLDENRLGEALPGVVRLDVNAAGIGWFIDSTPLADEEFAGESRAATDPQADGRVDLLTVLFHELAHQLGARDREPGVAPGLLMAESLPPSQRRLPSENDLDRLFAADALLDEILG